MEITDSNKTKKYYLAVQRRDISYTGIFFFGVKTTGIFCLPGCRARTPKPENIIYYTTSKEMLQNGYRPCKICKPETYTSDKPESIIKSIELIRNSPYNKITDRDLKNNGLNPVNIRRWFKKYHGTTYQVYQRMLRINNAFQTLKNDNTQNISTLDCGYESLSGFNYTFKNIIGLSPKNIRNKTAIIIDRFTTPLGPVFTCATEYGVCLLEFTDRRILETEINYLQKTLNGIILTGENPHIEQLKKELSEYFNHSRKKFDVKIHFTGSESRVIFWKKLINIPYGKTVSYRKFSESFSKSSAENIKHFNGLNKLAIIIPCHRLTGDNGKLTGYGGGLERKQWLLNHEK